MNKHKRPPLSGQPFVFVGGGRLTMCRLASRAYEHWRGLLPENSPLIASRGALSKF
jgi:hypothetical protein